MNIWNYHQLETDLCSGALEVARSKRPAYTGDNADVLFNFKKAAEAAGIDPLQAWIVLAHKHWDALVSAAKSRKIKQAEPLRGRAEDLINYVILGIALMVDEGVVDWVFEDEDHVQVSTQENNRS